MPTGRVAQKLTVLLTLQRIVDNCPERALQARTNEILCKPMEEQNPRLTRGSSAVYQQDRERSSFLAADQSTDDHEFL